MQLASFCLVRGGTRCCSLFFLCPGLLYTYALPTCSKPPHKFRIFDCFKCCRISIFLFIRDSCRRIRLQQIHSCGTSSMTIRTQLLLHLCRVIWYQLNRRCTSSVVNQYFNLSDATIAEHIPFDNSNLTQSDVRCAAKAANFYHLSFWVAKRNNFIPSIRWFILRRSSFSMSALLLWILPIRLPCWRRPAMLRSVALPSWSTTNSKPYTCAIVLCWPRHIWEPHGEGHFLTTYHWRRVVQRLILFWAFIDSFVFLWSHMFYLPFLWMQLYSYKATLPVQCVTVTWNKKKFMPIQVRQAWI